MNVYDTANNLANEIRKSEIYQKLNTLKNKNGQIIQYIDC